MTINPVLEKTTQQLNVKKFQSFKVSIDRIFREFIFRNSKHIMPFVSMIVCIKYHIYNNIRKNQHSRASHLPELYTGEAMSGESRAQK